MFTKEQLAKWEADGFTFPPEYSEWAVEKKESIEISISSISMDEDILSFILLMHTKNLKDNIAFITIEIVETSNLKSIIKNPIFSIKRKIDKDWISLIAEFDINNSIFSILYLKGVKLVAKAYCNKLESMTSQFGIPKEIISNLYQPDECLCKKSKWTGKT